MPSASFPIWRLVVMGVAPIVGMIAILALPGVPGIVAGLGVTGASLFLLGPLLQSTRARLAIGVLVMAYLIVIAGVLILAVRQ